jgi:GH43 family beta-xylosidase
MQGKDPSVVLKDGLFHLVQTDGCNIQLRVANSLGGLAVADYQTIYRPPSCYQVWAPEMHFISNRWYIYYTMNTNRNSNGRARRGFVAESEGTDVLGPYVNRGILFHDWWNIDGNVFSWSNRLFYTFSGEPVQGAQCIYIAPMSNPFTLGGPPALISGPVEPWERIGDPDVNEGSWGFSRGDQLFMVYSASGCWTDDYALGLLTLTGVDPLNPASWTKTGPVFTKSTGAYGPGHNCIVQDASGQWWNAYHANVVGSAVQWSAMSRAGITPSARGSSRHTSIATSSRTRSCATISSATIRSPPGAWS